MRLNCTSNYSSLSNFAVEAGYIEGYNFTFQLYMCKLSL